MSIKKLRNLNYIVGIIQLILCLFLVIWLFTINSDDTQLSFRIGEYNQPISEGSDHGAVSVRTIVLLLAIFTLITGLVHILAYAMSTKTYQHNVNRGHNWIRWVEYGITATIMIFVVAVTCGTNSTDVLLLLCVATLCCMICGYVSEATATTNKNVSMFTTAMGWILMITVFTVIIRRFASIYGQTRETENGPPSWVWAIVISMTSLFMSFGCIHLIHMRQQWKSNTAVSRKFHQQVEVSYTVASVVSKTLLVILLSSGLFARTP
jgi:hypothetical protein